MRIFLDTADFDEIRKRDETGLIDGVTTNPSLILKSGGDPVDVIKRIAGEFPHFESISAEVVAETAPEMIDQSQVFKELSNVTIKVPCTVEGLKACKAFARRWIYYKRNPGIFCRTAYSCCKSRCNLCVSFCWTLQ